MHSVSQARVLIFLSAASPTTPNCRLHVLPSAVSQTSWLLPLGLGLELCSPFQITSHPSRWFLNVGSARSVPWVLQTFLQVSHGIMHIILPQHLPPCRAILVFCVYNLHLTGIFLRAGLAFFFLFICPNTGSDRVICSINTQTLGKVSTNLFFCLLWKYTYLKWKNPAALKWVGCSESWVYKISFYFWRGLDLQQSYKKVQRVPIYFTPSFPIANISISMVHLSQLTNQYCSLSLLTKFHAVLGFP